MATYLKPPTPSLVINGYDDLEELVIQLKRDGLMGERERFSIDNGLGSRVKVAGDCRTCVSV